MRASLPRRLLGRGQPIGGAPEQQCRYRHGQVSRGVEDLVVEGDGGDAHRRGDEQADGDQRRPQWRPAPQLRWSGGLRLLSRPDVWLFLAAPPPHSVADHAQGKGRRDAKRCLRRVIARELFRLLERYDQPGVEILRVA
jgi:hypothetical protein